jgi:hypothetical protein
MNTAIALINVKTGFTNTQKIKKSTSTKRKYGNARVNKPTNQPFEGSKYLAHPPNKKSVAIATLKKMKTFFVNLRKNGFCIAQYENDSR